MLKVLFFGFAATWSDRTFEWSSANADVLESLRYFHETHIHLGPGDEYCEGGIGMKVFHALAAEFGSNVSLVSYAATPFTPPDPVEGVVQ